MSERDAGAVIAFKGTDLVGRGRRAEVATAAWRAAAGDPNASIHFFDAVTSQPIEIDLRGELRDVLERMPATPTPRTDGETVEVRERSRGPGRPKLGVVPREVTLLPRHWEWLNAQPGGASVALRKLVEDARRASAESDQRRAAQESAYRFMTAMAGDRPGFEEATRALFAGDARRFEWLVADWPADIRDHARALARSAFVEVVQPM